MNTANSLWLDTERWRDTAFTDAACADAALSTAIAAGYTPTRVKVAGGIATVWVETKARVTQETLAANFKGSGWQPCGFGWDAEHGWCFRLMERKA